jgi:NaMN:DMB phosphoribosyltransferase
MPLEEPAAAPPSNDFPFGPPPETAPAELYAPPLAAEPLTPAPAAEPFAFPPAPEPMMPEQPLHYESAATGIDDETYARKVGVVTRALHVNRPDRNPLDVLRTVGGFEIAAIAGAYIGAAAQRMAIVGDGFVATAAALAAAKGCPPFLDYWFAGHRSPEPGHSVQLALLQQEPLLDLQMRLGEGTGAALAVRLFDAAAAMMNDMATFDAAGVSNRGRREDAGSGR